MPVVGKTVESVQLAFTSGSPVDLTFRTSTYGVILRTVLTSDADVYINFDADADATCFVVQAGCPIEIGDISYTTISAMGVNGSGTLYILAMRN